jgi:hypothetical protein
MEAFLHRKPASPGASCNSCGAQGSDKRNILYISFTKYLLMLNGN